MTPLVSVIIPTYQRVLTLERAIKSIVLQDYPNLEIIIVDDHSSDSTPELVQNLQNQDPRIVYVRLERNVGPAGARNAGVEKSKGDLIAFLDSDDEWLPEKLTMQVALLEEMPEVGLIFTDCRLVDRNSGLGQKLSSVNNRFLSEIDLQAIPGKSNFYILIGPLQQTLFKKFFIVISSVIMRKAYIDLINGFDIRRFGTEDIDFFVRLAPHCSFIYWDLEKVQKFNDESGISKANERWLLENIRYYTDCLSSMSYTNLKPITKYNLERFYGYLILLYSIQWQPINASKLFIKSLKQLTSPKLAFLTLISFLGPLPLTFLNFLKKMNIFRKNIN